MLDFETNRYKTRQEYYKWLRDNNMMNRSARQQPAPPAPPLSVIDGPVPESRFRIFCGCAKNGLANGAKVGGALLAGYVADRAFHAGDEAMFGEPGDARTLEYAPFSRLSSYPIPEHLALRVAESFSGSPNTYPKPLGPESPWESQPVELTPPPPPSYPLSGLYNFGATGGHLRPPLIQMKLVTSMRLDSMASSHFVSQEFCLASAPTNTPKLAEFTIA